MNPEFGRERKIKVFAKKGFRFQKPGTGFLGTENIFAQTKPNQIADLPLWVKSNPMFEWAQKDGDLLILEDDPERDSPPKWLPIPIAIVASEDVLLDFATRFARLLDLEDSVAHRNPNLCLRSFVGPYNGRETVFSVEGGPNPRIRAEFHTIARQAALANGCLPIEDPVLFWLRMVGQMHLSHESTERLFLNGQDNFSLFRLLESSVLCCHYFARMQAGAAVAILRAQRTKIEAAEDIRKTKVADNPVLSGRSPENRRDVEAGEAAALSLDNTQTVPDDDPVPREPKEAFNTQDDGESLAAKSNTNRVWFERVQSEFALANPGQTLTQEMLTRKAGYELDNPRPSNTELKAWLKDKPRTKKADELIRQALRWFEQNLQKAPKMS